MAVAVVLAAGSGKRLGYELPKAFVPLAGRPMLEWSIDTFLATDSVSSVVVALPDGYQAPLGITGVVGGESRSESVANALQVVRADEETVLIHDAARPLISTETVEGALARFANSGADCVATAAAMADTVKEIDAEGSVVKTLDRSQLIAVQTPQIFKTSVLNRVVKSASPSELASATDDASLVELAGGAVVSYTHSELNFKVTTENDLKLAEAVLSTRAGIS